MTMHPAHLTIAMIAFRAVVSSVEDLQPRKVLDSQNTNIRQQRTP